jgi:hypothetical protein
MRAVYRQLNAFQFNAVEFNPRAVYQLLLGDEPTEVAAPEAVAAPQETLADLQQRYLPALQRLSEARLSGQPADPADEAAVVEFQQRSMTLLAGSAPAPRPLVEITLPEGVFDLGECWRAIHLLLTGKREEVPTEKREGLFGDAFFGKLGKLMPRQSDTARNLFSLAIFGGNEVPLADKRLNHGPARLLTPEDVLAVVGALDKIEPASLLLGYASLEAAGVPAPEAAEVGRQYARLRHFYVEAAAAGNAVVTCLC